MKTVFKIFLVAIVFVLFSFKKNHENNFIGTFGVSKNDPANIELTIKNDHTFIFKDFSDQKNKISVTGTWRTNGKFVFLQNEGSQTSFHKKWKFENNGMVAKSHKGMLFYRLTRCGAE